MAREEFDRRIEAHFDQVRDALVDALKNEDDAE